MYWGDFDGGGVGWRGAGWVGCFFGGAEGECDPSRLRPVPPSRRQEMWETLQRAEAAGSTDADLAIRLRDLVWPGQTWVREILISASENDWASLPAGALSEVLAAGRAYHTSKPVEDIFNTLREGERTHRANKLGRLARWHHSIHSGVLQDPCSLDALGPGGIERLL